MDQLQHQSLARGITVMETLARNGSCSLAEIHKQTGISKSSIRRLLATLVDRRLVRKSLADSRYRINITLPVSVGEPVPVEQAFVLDVSLPHVIELTKKISWPSDIHLLEGDRMRVLDSTRPLSPFHLYRGVVNRQVNIFGSATGMACLAQMKDAQIARIIAHTDGDAEWGLIRFQLTMSGYKKHLNSARQDGYGARIAHYVGVTVFEDRLSAIALPIFRASKLLGAVSLLWPKGYLSTGEFAQRYLGDLRETTQNISFDLEHLQPKG